MIIFMNHTLSKRADALDSSFNHIPKAGEDLQGSMGKFPMETLEKTSGLRVGRKKKAFLDGHLGSHVPDVGRGGFKLVGEWPDMTLSCTVVVDLEKSVIVSISIHQI